MNLIKLLLFSGLSTLYGQTDYYYYYYPPLENIGFSSVQHDLDRISLHDLSWKDSLFNLTVLTEYYGEVMGYGFVFSCYDDKYENERFEGSNIIYKLDPNPSDTLMFEWLERAEVASRGGVFYEGLAKTRPFLIFHLESKNVICTSMDYLTKEKW